MLSDQLMCWWFFVCVFAFWQTLDESLLLQTQLSRIESSSFQIMLTLTTLLPSGKLQRMWCSASEVEEKNLLERCFFCFCVGVIRILLSFLLISYSNELVLSVLVQKGAVILQSHFNLS